MEAGYMCVWNRLGEGNHILSVSEATPPTSANSILVANYFRICPTLERVCAMLCVCVLYSCLQPWDEAAPHFRTYGALDTLKEHLVKYMNMQTRKMRCFYKASTQRILPGGVFCLYYT